jgi:hypothetical protein
MGNFFSGDPVVRGMSATDGRPRDRLGIRHVTVVPSNYDRDEDGDDR